MWVMTLDVTFIYFIAKQIFSNNVAINHLHIFCDGLTSNVVIFVICKLFVDQ